MIFSFTRKTSFTPMFSISRKGLVLKNEEYTDIICHFEKISFLPPSVKDIVYCNIRSITVLVCCLFWQ